MEQHTIFGPFFTMFVLTLVVWIYMYVRRIHLFRTHGVNPNELTPGALASISPPAVSNPSDNLKNLFELPTIFYAVVLYLYVTMQVDTLYLAAAWIFLAFRILHSAVHCTFNSVPLRFWLYAISALAQWLMVLRVTWGVFFWRVGPRRRRCPGSDCWLPQPVCSHPLPLLRTTVGRITT